MKNVSMNLVRMSALLGVLMLTGQLSFAGDVSEKVVKKARYAVEQAAPHDWHTLAQSAEKCIRRGVNLKEAVAWLEQSIQIERTPYNLEIQGDYFAKNQLPKEAIRAYSESFRRGILADANYQGKDRIDNICEKIKRQVVNLRKAYDGDLEAGFDKDLSYQNTAALLNKILGSVW